MWQNVFRLLPRWSQLASSLVPIRKETFLSVNRAVWVCRPHGWFLTVNTLFRYLYSRPLLRRPTVTGPLKARPGRARLGSPFRVLTCFPSAPTLLPPRPRVLAPLAPAPLTVLTRRTVLVSPVARRVSKLPMTVVRVDMDGVVGLFRPLLLSLLPKLLVSDPEKVPTKALAKLNDPNPATLVLLSAPPLPLAPYLPSFSTRSMEEVKLVTPTPPTI